MEGIFVIFVLFWVFKAMKSAVEKQTKGQTAGKGGAAQSRPTPAQDLQQQAETGAQQAVKRPVQQPKVVQTRIKLQPEKPKKTAETVSTEGMELGEGLAGYEPITHRMLGMSARREYTGSLGGGSTEGEDICDPSLAHERERTPEPGSVYESELGGAPLVDVSARALLSGVVMSEILTRPAQRKWGRR